jgi:hypothetical protein
LSISFGLSAVLQNRCSCHSTKAGGSPGEYATNMDRLSRKFTKMLRPIIDALNQNQLVHCTKTESPLNLTHENRHSVEQRRRSEGAAHSPAPLSGDDFA